jgi:hypothetical protein
VKRVIFFMRCPLRTPATSGPIVPAPENGAACRGNKSTRRKTAPVTFCAPETSHDLTWDWTLTTAIGSRRLTAWAMAHPREKLFLCEKWIASSVRSYPVNYKACDILSTRWRSQHHTPVREFSKSLDRSQQTWSWSPRSPDFNPASYTFGGHTKSLD